VHRRSCGNSGLLPADPATPRSEIGCGRIGPWRAGRASERTPSFPARIGMRQTPALCQPSGRAGAGSGAPRRSLARRSRDPGQPNLCACGNDPAEPRQPAWIGPAQAPVGALPRPANDAHTGRSRPQSQGGSQPPRSNGQALDVARKRVTVAGRRCRASGRVRPCWDPAFPCCSPLTGWASGPVAASRPSGLAAPSNYLSEGGQALVG
jgi:hypothetical protein